MGVLFLLLLVYAGALLGDKLSYLTTNFLPPRGLWWLVPLRVRGWRSIFDDRKVYRIKRSWEHIDFDNYEMEGK